MPKIESVFADHPEMFTATTVERVDCSVRLARGCDAGAKLEVAERRMMMALTWKGGEMRVGLHVKHVSRVPEVVE